MNVIMSHVHMGLCNLGFILFEVPYYWVHHTPVIGIIHLLVFTISWVCITITEFSDPGIILSKSCI